AQGIPSTKEGFHIVELRPDMMGGPGIPKRAVQGKGLSMIFHSGKGEDDQLMLVPVNSTVADCSGFSLITFKDRIFSVSSACPEQWRSDTPRNAQRSRSRRVPLWSKPHDQKYNEHTTIAVSTQTRSTSSMMPKV